MSLTSNNKKDGKKGNKTPKHNAQGSKFFPKATNSGGFNKKPMKTGGTRGS